MVFTSINFLLFFPTVLLLYYFVPKKFKVIFLLIVSYYFYLNIKPIFIVLLFGVTISTFAFTRLIAHAKQDSWKIFYMRVNIILVLLPLLFFKYFTVINSEIIEFFQGGSLMWPLPAMKYMLPIGISFYTFMAIGYTIDVFNEDVTAEPSIFNVGLFLSFFPIILSGPIERAGNIFPQLEKINNLNSDNLVKGAKLMLWGYFMKLCVADRLGIYIDTVFNNISQHNGNSLALASALYPFQLYSDLGGYSLIAIGTARCLGLTIIPNFNRPFFSTSMAELWRRWHMSLIQWLTDYIYTPLVFKLRKRKMTGVVIALMLTFIISGIWHGAAIVFLVWGFLQGIFLSVEAVTKKYKSRFELNHNLSKNSFYIFLSAFLTFILFTFSQIFAKCNNIDEAMTVINKILTQRGSLFLESTNLAYGIIFLFILFFKDFKDEFFSNNLRFYENNSIIIRFISYSITIVIIIAMGVLDSGEFIYFEY